MALAWAQAQLRRGDPAAMIGPVPELRVGTLGDRESADATLRHPHRGGRPHKRPPGARRCETKVSYAELPARTLAQFGHVDAAVAGSADTRATPRRAGRPLPGRSQASRIAAAHAKATRTKAAGRPRAPAVVHGDDRFTDGPVGPRHLARRRVPAGRLLRAHSRRRAAMSVVRGRGRARLRIAAKCAACCCSRRPAALRLAAAVGRHNGVVGNRASTPVRGVSFFSHRLRTGLSRWCGRWSGRPRFAVAGGQTPPAPGGVSAEGRLPAKRAAPLLRSPQVLVLLFYGLGAPTEVALRDREALWQRIDPYLRRHVVRAKHDYADFSVAEFKDDHHHSLLITEESC